MAQARGRRWLNQDLQAPWPLRRQGRHRPARSATSMASSTALGPPPRAPVPGHGPLRALGARSSDVREQHHWCSGDGVLEGCGPTATRRAAMTNGLAIRRRLPAAARPAPAHPGSVLRRPRWGPALLAEHEVPTEVATHGRDAGCDHAGGDPPSPTPRQRCTKDAARGRSRSRWRPHGRRPPAASNDPSPASPPGLRRGGRERPPATPGRPRRSPPGAAAAADQVERPHARPNPMGRSVRTGWSGWPSHAPASAGRRRRHRVREPSQPATPTSNASSRRGAPPAWRSDRRREGGRAGVLMIGQSAERGSVAFIGPP